MANYNRELIFFLFRLIIAKFRNDINLYSRVAFNLRVGGTSLLAESIQRRLSLIDYIISRPGSPGNFKSSLVSAPWWRPRPFPRGMRDKSMVERKVIIGGKMLRFEARRDRLPTSWILSEPFPPRTEYRSPAATRFENRNYRWAGCFWQ